MKLMRVKSPARRQVVSLRSTICLLIGLAVPWCGPYALAQSTRSVDAGAASTVRLQSMVNAAATQFKLAFRNNQAEQTRRRDQLVAAVKAWRSAERSESNNRLMADWLQAAIHNSMPGKREPLPPLPQFSRAPAPAPVATTQAQVPPMSANSRRVEAKKTPATSRPGTMGVTTPPASAQQANNRPAQSDFWSAHPANSDLPANLSSGNPFQDDP
jgi:hypothetical protein